MECGTMSSTFPQFSDGNVEIHLSSCTTDKFVLHSYVLALHSSWFKASLSDRWNGGSAPPDGLGTNRWVYELRFDKDSSLGLLTRRTDTVEAQPKDTVFIDRNQDTDGMTSEAKTIHTDRVAKIKAHEQLLGVLYHLAPAFSHASFQSARVSILRLAEVAEAYGAQKVVKMPVESHLRFYKDEVLNLCATAPIDMLELAMTVQSEWIFMEASTLILGRSSHFFTRNTKRMKELKVHSLLRRKRAEFKEQLQSYDFKLMVMKSESNNSDDMNAMDYFRHWFAERARDRYGSGLRTGYAKVYRDIKSRSRFGSISTEVAELQTWLDISYTNPDAAVWEEHIRKVFRKAADVIEPILEDVTRLQDKSMDLYKSLRFMSVGDEELPWVKKP